MILDEKAHCKDGIRVEPSVREIEIPLHSRAPVRADVRTASPGGRRPLIVVCHGFLGYKRWGFFPYLSDRLAAAGFDVLTMSFSLNGVDEATGLLDRPEAFARNTVSAEIADLAGVLAYIGSGALTRDGIGGGPLGLFGHSRGGAVALLAAGVRHVVHARHARSLHGTPQGGVETRRCARVQRSPRRRAA
jgi:dienelactone hydrolase